jgi:hypothetical protein
VTLLAEATAAVLIAEAILKGDVIAIADVILQSLPSDLEPEEAAEIAASVAEMLVSEPVV